MNKSNLWTPWRIDYILKKDPTPDSGCLFCRLVSENNDKENLILNRTEFSYTMLNRFPYSSCHILVLPITHKADINELEDEAYIDLMIQVRKVTKVLQDVLQPGGINVGLNMGAAAGAGIAEHLHYHIVPRWNGDHNFMPVIADTMIMPEYLEKSYDKLKPFF